MTDDSNVNEIDEVEIDVQLICYPPDEIMKIKEVMRKDKCLQEQEMQRKKKLEESLEESLLSLKLNDVGSSDTYCPLCNEKFSFIMNKKKICLLCEKGFCGNCLYKFYSNTVEICKVCFLQCIRDGKSGRWFNFQSETNGRLRRSASVVIMSSIRRIKSKFLTHNATERQSLHLPEVRKENLQRERSSIAIPPSPMRPESPLVRSVPPTGKPSPRIPNRSYIEKDSRQISKEISEGSNGTLDHLDQSTIGNSILPERPVDVVPVNKEVKDDSTMRRGTLPSNLGSMAPLSTSTMSMYSEIEESYKTGISVSGEIYFSTFYEEHRKQLIIYIDQCRNIAVADKKHRKTEPYIKTYLMPDRTKMGKRKSTSKKMSLSPVFKETLSYNIDKELLQSRTLSVAVWHKSSILKYNIFLGEVLINLAEANLTTKECTWYTLQEKRRIPLTLGTMLAKGEIILKIKYKPSTLKDGKGSLHVVIVGARNLEHDRATVNSYVKGYLLPDKNPKSKQKTKTCKGTLNPTWDSVLLFPEVTLRDLRDRSLQLSIYHQNTLKGNEFLGGVRLNLGLGLHSSEHVPWMDAQGDEKDAWEKLLSNPYEYSDFTLNLRPNLDF